MAELPEVFNPSEEPTIEDGFQPMPEGWYQVKIIGSDWKENSKKTGGYIELEYIVLDGDHEGRKFKCFYNVINANDTTMQIAKRQISSLCAAIDVEESFRDTEVLHDIPLNVELVIRPGTKGFSDRNDIKKYRSINDSSAINDDDVPF